MNVEKEEVLRAYQEAHPDLVIRNDLGYAFNNYITILKTDAVVEAIEFTLEYLKKK